MTSPDEAVVRRARALVGVRFRPQGRSAAGGLDCVGLAALALGRGDVRADYALRGGDRDMIEAELCAAGLCRVAPMEAGDLLLMAAGPGQLHLGLWTGGSLIHADAGLRRVVERPGEPPWPVLSIWRD